MSAKQDPPKLTNLPRLEGSPLEALRVQREGQEGTEDDHGLQADLLPFVMFWLSSPVKESDDILSHLRSSGRGA